MSKQILIIIASLLVLMSSNSMTQEKPVFNITGVETAEFPLVKSYIIAKNGRMNEAYYSAPLNLPNPPAFDLSENGISKDETSLVLKCEEIDGLLPVHIALVVDASSSMFDPWNGGESRADVLERAVGEFIDSIKFENGTSIHIVPFSGNNIGNNVWRDWNYTAEDAKEDFEVYQLMDGRTDFNTPLWKEPSGKNVNEIFKTRPPTERKIVVFLSDGEHATSGSGSTDFDRQRVIDDLQNHGIEFYSILFDADAYGSRNDLKQISLATGGEYIDVDTEKELRDFYRKITDNLKSQTVCWLEWESELECDEVTERNVEVTFTRTTYDPIQRNFTYTPPEDKGVALVSRDKDDLYYDNSGSVTQNITLTSEVGDFLITGFNITNNDNDFEIPEFDNMPTGGFVLDEGESKTFAVNYIKDPSDTPKDFKLEFETNLCPVEPVDLIAPCGPITESIDMGDINLSGSTDYVATDVFTNNSTAEISGTITIEGADKDEFAIKSVNGNAGADFTLTAGESMNVELTVTPSTPGTKTANLDYGIISDCGLATSAITANVIEADLALSPMNWDLVRLNNPVNMTYTITNSNDNAVEIEEITLSDDTKGFSLGDVSSSYTSLTPNGGETSFDITFTPNTEGNTNVDLIVKIKNRDETLSARLTGIGFLPEIAGNNLAFTDIKVNTAAAPKDFVVTNNSDYGTMVVKDIRLKAGSDTEFSLDLTNFTSGTSLSKGQNITIPVNYLPTAVTNNTGTIVVEADNVEGPEPVTFMLNEFEITGAAIPGDGITLPVTNFGPILSCELETKTITLENNTSQMITVTGSLVDDNFRLKEDFFQIDGNSTKTVAIDYTPSFAGSHSATAIFSYSDGFEVTAPLEGEAKIELTDLISFGSSEYSNLVGNYANINFDIDLSAYNIRPSIFLDNLILTISYNNTTHYLAEPTLNSNLNITPVLNIVDEVGKSTLVATYTGAIPKNGIMSFEVPFLTTLGNDTMSVIEVKAGLDDLSCLTIRDASVNSYLEGCNLSGSLINLSGNNNSIELNGPNPTDNVLSLKYELAFDNDVEIDIFSSFGQRVKTVKIQNANQGISELDMDISNLPMGTYTAKYKVNSYVETIRFIKIK